jgi:hypothetical protein
MLAKLKDNAIDRAKAFVSLALEHLGDADTLDAVDIDLRHAWYALDDAKPKLDAEPPSGAESGEELKIEGYDYVRIKGDGWMAIYPKGEGEYIKRKDLDTLLASRPTENAKTFPPSDAEIKQEAFASNPQKYPESAKEE